MASEIGEQSSRTPAGGRPASPAPANPLERLHHVPPAAHAGARSPVSSDTSPEAGTDRPAPIVRLPSPPKRRDGTPAGAGTQVAGGGLDDVVPEDDRTPENADVLDAAGDVEGRGDGGAGRSPGTGWDATGMPAWLSGTPPVPPAPPPPGPRGRGDDSATGADDLGDGDWGSDRWDSGQWEWDDDEPSDGRSRSRFAVAPPAAISLIVVGVIACAVAGFTLWRSEGPMPVVDFPQAAAGISTTPAAPHPSGGVAPTSGRSPSTPSPDDRAPQTHSMVVSVVGLVARPGLVRLPSGARVGEAIDRAGGARKNADLLSLNLAQVLRDGDQVLVGYAGRNGGTSMRSAVVGPGSTGTSSSAGDSTAPVPAAGDAPSSESGTVNLNTASQTELESLPGVGPVTAKSILDWRQRNGRFASVDQLTEVDGIGPARLEKLRGKVTV